MRSLSLQSFFTFFILMLLSVVFTGDAEAYIRRDPGGTGFTGTTTGTTISEAELVALDGMDTELGLLSGLTATAAEINSVADATGKVVDATAATLVVTAALHANRTITFNRAAGVTATLPAATGTGDVYRFIIGTTATSNANIIQVANATDVMDGSLNIQQDTDADGTVKVWRADAGDDTMTFAGAATTGGIVGGYIECRDYAAGFWSCQAFTQSGGGSEATPFSAGVS